MSMSPAEEYAIKVMLDDVTFMLFDLERGGFISQECDVAHDIGDNFAFTYKRELVEETMVNGWEHIISNFHITAFKNDISICKFITRGSDQAFTLYNIEAFVLNMFINRLETYREEMFSINK